MATFFLFGEISEELSALLISDSDTLCDRLGVDFDDFSLLSLSFSAHSSTDFDLGFCTIQFIVVSWKQIFMYLKILRQFYNG